MDMEVFPCRKNAMFSGAHKIGAAISGPRIVGKQFYGHEDFSDKALLPTSRYFSFFCLFWGGLRGGGVQGRWGLGGWVGFH